MKRGLFACLAIVIAIALPRAASHDVSAAEGGNWSLPGYDLANRRFFPLAKIDPSNVANVKLRWMFHTGARGGFEATPIVIDGTMYLSTAGDDVVALDATTGALEWRYRHTLRRKPCCGNANRGVAVSGNLVFEATIDARLIALDRATGALRWDVPLDAATGNIEHASVLSATDVLHGAPVVGESGVFANMAPQVFGGNVIVGITGVGYGLHVGTNGKPEGIEGGVVGVAGDFGSRGYYAAFDAKTGARRWLWSTIPNEGWEGTYRSTTPDGAALHRNLADERSAAVKMPNAYKFGGGSAWTTPAVDPARGLLYVGVGNPSPQFEDASRPGDNLYSVSIVALDAKTGTMRWAYQEVPHDLWGYDVASPPVLLDVDVNGRRAPAVMQAGKTGWLYVLDRTTGALLYKSDAFVTQKNLFARPTADGIVIAPGAFGGSSWSPVAYDESRSLAFVAGANIPMRYRVQAGTPETGNATYTEAVPDPDSLHSGTVTAIDTATGHIRWQHATKDPLIGGMLATATGLAFTGEGSGAFDAFDSQSGKLLWTYACDAGVNAPPITYEVAGVQYVAVAAGGNAIMGYKRGDELLSFTLP